MQRAAGVIGGLAERNGGARALIALCLVLAIGTGLRLGYAWDGWEPVADARAYAALAENIAEDGEFTTATEGRVATQEATNYSPGLPLFTAGLYWTTGGENERLARVVLALIASTAILFTYLIGRRLSGPVAGVIGAAAIAVYPAYLEYGGMLMTEPLAAPLLTGSVLGILRALERDGLAAWVVPAVGLGLTAMVRPEYLYIGVVLALVVAFLRRGAGSRPALGAAAVLLVGMAVVVAPWTIRNYVVLDRFAGLSTGGGQVLFAGWYLPSDGDPQRVGEEVLERHPEIRADVEGIPGAAGQPPLESILAALAARQFPRLEPDRALSKMGRKLIWRDISERPGDTAVFVVRKGGRVWLTGPRDVMKEPPWVLLHALIVAGGLGGLVVLALRRRREALVIGVVLIAVTGIGLLTVASPRRTLVILPLAAALAGFGWVELGRALAAGRSDSPDEPVASLR